jgi:predicted nucleotidyltransferase
MRSQQEVRAIINQLCSGLKPLFPQGPMEAILFGSYARRNADDESDIDLLFLVDTPREEINRKLWDVSCAASDMLLKHGVMVSPLVENRDFYHQYRKAMPFFTNIEKEGVAVSA